MIKTIDVLKILDKYAPAVLAEDWDNSGWQINLYNPYVKKIMVCLTVTDDVINQAVDLGCDMIVSHHPLIFNPIKKIHDIKIIKAIKNNIQIFALHTNADKTKGGTSDMLAEYMLLRETAAINDFVRAGYLKYAMTLDEFLSKVKLQLNVSHLKVINEGAKTSIKNVAVCAGAGAEFIEPLGRYNIDAYVTADVKYHQALEPTRFVIIDVGHFESEKPFVERITNMLRKAKGDKVEVVIANEKPAWNIV